MSLDPDSMKFLEDVKRGKLRRFVMIMKGEKILTLIVYKKGSVEKYKKDAKEDKGAGQFYHGVIEGKGMNIVFKLCTLDGFTEPPGKDVKLKMFLSEETGIKFRPTYAIVTQLPEVSDDDETNTFPQSNGAPEVPVAPPTPPDPAIAAKVTEALNKLTPLIKQALSAAPERKLEILQPAATIKDLIAKAELSPARNQLLDFATLLKQIIGAAKGPAAEDLLAVWRDAKESVDGQLQKFRNALQKTDDPYLTKIASGGVDTFVMGPGREYVTLQTALFAYQGADGATKKQAGQKLLTAVKSYKQYVASNQFIQVCDTNQLCGPLSVEKTLSEALTKLEQSVGSMVA